MHARLASAKRLRGSVRVPGDKSIAHRALLCGALSAGATKVEGVPRNADLTATIRALEVCGVELRQEDDTVTVQGAGAAGWAGPPRAIDCMNSGTTMRLLLGVLAGQRLAARLHGDHSLSRRPMLRVAEPLRRMGAEVALDGDFPPVVVAGGRRLRAVDYALNVASAQVKSALLLAGLAAEGSTRLSGRLDSRDHTERMLPCFGASLDRRDGVLTIEGQQRLHATCVAVPGDPSSAAFWIAAALITPHSRLELPAVCLNPTRTGFIQVVRRMGASIGSALLRREPEPVGNLLVTSSSLRGVRIDAHEIPSLIDELPLIAVLATQAQGQTIVRGAHELRLKESDRIEAISVVLRRMGADVRTFEDGFCIDGPQELRGSAIDPHGDHRIAMAAAVAALSAHGETTIRDAECVNVSYPAFFQTLQSLNDVCQ